MKIEAISVKFPSRVVTLDDTLDMIKHYSKESFNGSMDRTLNVLKKILLYSGAQERRWLTESEKPISFIQDAVSEALDKANCNKEEIDLLIYTGIGRGFTEPGGSYIVAKNLGLYSVECFDILDACMSWVRALNIAYAYIKTKKYRKILIVNGEFNSISGEAFFPGNYQLKNFKQLKYTFPNYTIGDAATATIVSNEDAQPWEWHFSARTDLADLCTIPTEGFSIFSEIYSKIGKNGAGRFCSFGNEMHSMGTPEVIDIFKKLTISKDVIKKIYPHASSKQAWGYCAEVCGVEDKMYYVYPKYGNLVSASVPAGIALSWQEGQINRGDKLVLWVGSAGMSFSSISFSL